MWCTSAQPALARRPETRWRFHLSRCPGFGVHFYSRIRFDYSNYLDDFSKFSGQLSGNLSFRITRGLSLNMNASGSLIRNQLYLPKKDLTDEEILLQRRQLATDSRYRVSFGFSYTFGSIFNNVVNPRFDGARGGQNRFF